MIFKYKVHKIGEERPEEGETEANDKFHLSKLMRDKGLVLISAEEVNKNQWIDFERLNEMVVRVGLHDKVIFANNLSAMIGAGLSLARALNVLERQTKNLKLKRVIKEIEVDVDSGKSLSSSLGKFPNIFSPIFVSMVAAGEESGNLPGSLKIVGEHLEKSYNLHKKIKGALTYPIVIIVAMVIIGFLMLTFVVPNLVSTFKEFNVELPFSTKLVIAASDLMLNYSIYVIVFLFAFLLLGYKFLRTERGKKTFSFFILHLPLVSGIVKQMNAAVTARTLSSLLSSGVNMIESLEITSKVLQNVYYKEFMDRTRQGVLKGEALSSFFQKEEKLFPILVGELSEVGEETGKLSEMLLNIAVFYENEVEAVTKDLSTIIEPLLMIFIGISVGFFAISMIQPIYSITEAV